MGHNQGKEADPETMPIWLDRILVTIAPLLPPYVTGQIELNIHKGSLGRTYLKQGWTQET